MRQNDRPTIRFKPTLLAAQVSQPDGFTNLVSQQFNGRQLLGFLEPPNSPVSGCKCSRATQQVRKTPQETFDFI